MASPFFRFRLSSLLMAVSVVAACLSWYVNYFTRQPNLKLVTLGGSSAMSPTLSREILVVDFNAYRHAVPTRWEIVVLNPKEQSGGGYVADVLRVIGLPGETVSIANGDLIINGAPVTIPQRLHSLKSGWPLSDPESANIPFVVPVGHYFLLGDNPENACDSRELGAFPKADIRGRISGNR